jgi:hypothetical protein
MKEALQRALDALGPTPPECCGCQAEWQIAITAIKAALEAKDEPEINLDHVICPNCVHQFRAIPKNVQRLMLDASFEPPFTTPPQRTWVGLTDEEISALAWNLKVDLQVIRLVQLEVMERNT